MIAADDASPDNCGAILDARGCGRSTCPGRPGPARMHGLAEPTGAYVWFTDPDDPLAGRPRSPVPGKAIRAATAI